MEIITKQAFEDRCENAKVLVTSNNFPKVLETPEGKMIKVFIRRKKIISKSLLFPPVKRFIKNAQSLAKKGIPSVTIEKAYYCPSLKRYMIVYPKIKGEEVRQLASQEGDNSVLIIANYIARLHEEGVFFRAIHLGNLILDSESATVSIIDMVDLKLAKKSLGISHRTRNIFHMLKNKEDFEIYKKFGVENFLAAYFQAANLTAFRKKMMRHLLARKIKLLHY